MFDKGPLYAIEDEASTSIGADVAELDTDPEVPETEEDEEVEELEAPEEDPEETDEKNEKEEEPKEEGSHPSDRPSIQTIEKKFPGFFKSFPQMRDVYFREREFTKLYPTLDEAKESVENNEAFTNIRASIVNSDGSEFIKSVQQVGPEKLVTFATNFLPTLVKVNPDAFWACANPLLESVVLRMIQTGEQSKNEDLKNAGIQLSQFFFGSTEVAEGKKSFSKTPEKSEVTREREEFETQKHTEFTHRVATDLDSDLTKMIDSDKLDPQGIFSPWMKKTVIDSIKQEVRSQLAADSGHLRYMDSLFAKAKQEGRNQQSLDRIKAAYLSRVKSLIPAARIKVVSEATGTRSRVAQTTKQKLEVVNGRKDIRGGGKPSNGKSSGPVDSKRIDYSKTSDLDILNDKITTR